MRPLQEYVAGWRRRTRLVLLVPTRRGRRILITVDRVDSQEWLSTFK